MKNVISLSGGLDSTSLLIHLLAKNAEVYAVTFDYGQKHCIEIDFAKKNVSYLLSRGFKIHHKVVDITDCTSLLQSSLTDEKYDVPEGHYEDENMKSTFVPNRNSIFTSIIYGYAITLYQQLNTNITISLGVHSGDHTIYPDCRPEFFASIMNSFKIGNWNSENIDIYLPFINYDKKKIIQNAIDSCNKLNLNFNDIYTNTITTYSPDKNGLSHGRTGSDIERIIAFHSLGLQDPASYTEDWDKIVEYALNIEKKHNS